MKEQITLYNIEELHEIEDYESITCIRTSNYYQSNHFEHLLGNCINLEEAYFLRSGFFKVALPKTLFDLPKLHTLVFNGAYWAIPEHLHHLKQLKILGIQGVFLTHFPTGITELPLLEELDFSASKWDELANLSLLTQLKQLQHLNLLRSGLTQILPILTQLTHLNELLVPKSVYNKLVKKHPELCAKIPYLYSHSTLENKYGYTLLNICRKNKYDWGFRAILFNLLAGNAEKLEHLATKEAILKITDVKLLETLRLKALEYFGQRWNDISLHQGAHLTVAGKLGINKKELKAKLKEQGIKYSAKITNKTTHLLLGQLSHGIYQEALERNIPILTEQMVLSFIDNNSEQYLVGGLETNLQQVQQISSLLLSNQDENILLALALFKQGGFPLELLTDLFIAYKQSNNIEVKRETERLLRQYGSIALVDEVKKRHALLSKYSAEGSLSRKLKRLSNQTELNTLKIAWYAYEHYKKGISYLIKALPSEEKIAFLKSLIKDDCLKLQQLGLTSLPPELFELKEIKVIDLSYNYQLASIPTKYMHNLQHLEQLVLRGNYKIRDNFKLIDKLKAALPNVRIQF